MTAPIDDNGTQLLPAKRHDDLPKHTRDLLDQLRPEEVQALKDISRLGPEGIKQLLDAVRLAQSVMTVSRFVRWLLVGLVAIFIGSVLLAENIMKVWTWISTKPPVP